MRSSLCLVALAACLLSPLGAQTTVTLEPSKDNSLYEPSGSLSNGSGTGLFAGKTAVGQIRRCLLAFDLSSIPSGATIQSASLDLHVTQASPFSATNILDLYPLLADWGEGASVAFGGQGGGAPAQTGDATWINTFFNTGTWATPGGDFLPVSSATATTGAAGTTTTWTSPQMAADVQGWLSTPATNFGWLLKGAETATATARKFGSREEVAGLRPVLTISYTAAIPPATVVSTGTGCNASNGNATVLAANGLPQLGNLGFSIAVTGPADGLSTAFYLAATTGPALPVGNCFIYLDLVTATSFITAGVSPIPGIMASGSSSVPFPIPNNPSLVGVSATVQVAVFDTTLLLSNALTLTIGS